MQSSSVPLSTLECTMRTLRQEGVLAFYKGMLSPLLGNAPINAIVFGAKGHAGRVLDQHFPRTEREKALDRPAYWRGAVASTWGGALQCVVVVPTELVKCKMQVQSSSGALALPGGEPHFKGSIHCARYILKTRGVRGLFLGWWVTFWRDVPGYAAWFLAYDVSKDALVDSFVRTPHPRELPAPPTLLPSPPPAPVVHAHAHVSPPMWVSLVAGSIAGPVTWLSTYPFDVVCAPAARVCAPPRTCMHSAQSRGLMVAACAAALQLKSIIQTSPPGTPARELKMSYIARREYARHGYRFFFRGLAPTLVRAVPVSAVTFAVYEWYAGLDCALHACRYASGSYLCCVRGQVHAGAGAGVKALEVLLSSRAALSTRI